MGEHTQVQIGQPYIIEYLPVGLTTEDEEQATIQGRRMGETTTRPGTISHNAGPTS